MDGPPTQIPLPPGVLRPLIVRRRDGRLEGFHMPESDSPRNRVERIVSTDDGFTWDDAPAAVAAFNCDYSLPTALAHSA